MYNVRMASIDLTDFWAALWVSGANPGCPSCGGTNWGDDSFVTKVPEFDPTTGELDYEDGLPAVALVCANCRKCERDRKFHRTSTRASYTCDSCGLHVHPMKGTIFEKSTTSLQLWFYAMYLMASTRCGISAKQLERELGVTYKTAHRMMKQIRTELMTDAGDEPPSG